ncbi:TetR/AcrR family transcriptional regulator [Catellatospora coxensis]
MIVSASSRELLDRVIAYAAAEGITGRSLREIAAGVGTSHRMLLYHFGSREGLLAAVVGLIEQQQRDLLGELADRVASSGPRRRAPRPANSCCCSGPGCPIRNCGRTCGCSSRSSGWPCTTPPAPAASWRT